MNAFLERDAENKGITHELTWYFCRSESACGVRSNYMGMINASESSGFGSDDPLPTRVAEAIRRRRAIERVTSKLPHQCQRYFWASCGPYTLPYELVNVLGDATPGALALSPPGAPDLLSLCLRVLLGTATPEDRLSVTQWVVAGRQVEANAYKEYRRILSSQNKQGTIGYTNHN